MAVEHIEILVEEPSMKAALDVLLPKVLATAVTFTVHPSQCKNDLLDNLPKLLGGYRHWLPDAWRIVVVLDRDDDQCNGLKNRLEAMAATAGMSTKTAILVGTWQVVNRMAIEELEAWFFGDMDAVRAAYPGVGATIERQERYRDPDAIKGGTWEALERVLKRAGYFKTGLRKVEAAGAIAANMDPWRNRSGSFQVFRDTLQEMVQP